MRTSPWRVASDLDLSFFADGFTRNGDPVPSTAYREKVLALDPKGKCDPVRGGIEWLKHLSVIDETDEAAIREVKEARNLMAHELGEIVMGDRMPDLSELFPKLASLIRKIERWWIVHVDVPTNPEFDGKDVDEESVTSGPEIAMSVLWDLAMGDEREAWSYYRAWLESRERTRHGH